MRSCRLVAVAAAAFALACGLSSALPGANRLYVEDQTLRIGDSGQRIPLRCDNDEGVRGFSVAIDYDPAVLDVIAMETTVVTAETQFQGGDFENGRIYYGVVLDVQEGVIVPPSQNANFLSVVVDVVTDTPTVTEIAFRDERFPGDPDRPDELNIMVSSEGRPVQDVAVENGQITVVDTLPPEAFKRGDSNGDGDVNVSDPQWTLNFLFLGGGDPPCPDAADANDDDDVNISDPQFTLNFLFLGGPAPPAPGNAACGPDETDDGLGPCADPAGVCS